MPFYPGSNGGGGGGTVTSVATAVPLNGGPITGSGTIGVNVGPRFVVDFANDPMVITDTTDGSTTGIFVERTGLLVQSINGDGRIAVMNYNGEPRFTALALHGSIAAPSGVLNGNTIGIFNARAYDGTDFGLEGSGWLYFVATQDFATGAHGTEARIATTPDDTETFVDRLIVGEDGNVRISNTGTFAADDGNAVQVTGGMSLDGGTVVPQLQGTITLSGTVTGTIDPTGITSALVNVGTADGTIAVAPGFVGQALRVEVKQGATAHSVAFDSSVSFGATVPSYTATASANARDILQLLCEGTVWAMGAVSQGFTV